MDNVPTISGTVNEAAGNGIGFYCQPLRAIVFDGAELNTTGEVDLNGASDRFAAPNSNGFYGYHFKGMDNFSGTADTFNMNATGMGLIVHERHGLATGVTLNVNAGGLYCMVDDAIHPGAVVNVNEGGLALAGAGTGQVPYLAPLASGTITVNAGGAVYIAAAGQLAGGADWDFQPGSQLILDCDAPVTNQPSGVNFILTKVES